MLILREDNNNLILGLYSLDNSIGDDGSCNNSENDNSGNVRDDDGLEGERRR